MKKKTCLFFMVCMMFLLAGCAEKIDLNQYLEVEYEGVNEHATAKYEIDYVDLISDYDEIFGFDENDLEDEDGEDFLEDMEDAIDGELNEDKKLKNGDELTFTWDVSAKKIEDKYKVKFEYTDVTMTVEGLDELEEVDAFEGVEVTFDGPSGYATAAFNARNQKYDMFVYHFSGGENLKNGDTVTVTLLDGYMEDCIEEGIIPKETVKTYKVEGLTELETFDAFEGLKVTFSGYAPYGYVSLDDRATRYDELSFSCSASKVSNGDEIIVELKQYSVDRCIKNYNVSPETTSKTYVVSGLDTLVMEYDDIPEEKWTEMGEEWSTYLLENMNSYWNMPETLKNVKYIGRALGKPSAESMEVWSSAQIYITLFFEVTVERPEQEPFNYYYTLEFVNWRQKPDGSYVYDEFSEPGKYYTWLGVRGNTFVRDGLQYIGFDTFNAAYEEEVFNDKAGYNTTGEFLEGYEYVTE